MLVEPGEGLAGLLHDISAKIVTHTIGIPFRLPQQLRQVARWLEVGDVVNGVARPGIEAASTLADGSCAAGTRYGPGPSWLGGSIVRTAELLGGKHGRPRSQCRWPKAGPEWDC